MKARLAVLAVSLLVAGSCASAAENTPALHHTGSRTAGTGEPSPLVQGGFIVANAGLDEAPQFSGRAVRLYRVADGGAGRSAAPSGASGRAGNDATQSAAGSKKDASPQPGSWAMILAGLLGVGAIARRRMSV